MGKPLLWLQDKPFSWLHVNSFHPKHTLNLLCYKLPLALDTSPLAKNHKIIKFYKQHPLQIQVIYRRAHDFFYPNPHLLRLRRETVAVFWTWWSTWVRDRGEGHCYLQQRSEDMPRILTLDDQLAIWLCSASVGVLHIPAVIWKPSKTSKTSLVNLLIRSQALAYTPSVCAHALYLRNLYQKIYV